MVLPHKLHFYTVVFLEISSDLISGKLFHL